VRVAHSDFHGPCAERARASDEQPAGGLSSNSIYAPTTSASAWVRLFAAFRRCGRPDL